MKPVVKQSMVNMMTKYLMNFRAEPDKDDAQIASYASHFADEFERYLSAYNDFKEEN